MARTLFQSHDLFGTFPFSPLVDFCSVYQSKDWTTSVDFCSIDHVSFFLPNRSCFQGKVIVVTVFIILVLRTVFQSVLLHFYSLPLFFRPHLLSSSPVFDYHPRLDVNLVLVVLWICHILSVLFLPRSLFFSCWLPAFASLLLTTSFWFFVFISCQLCTVLIKVHCVLPSACLFVSSLVQPEKLYCQALPLIISYW